MATSKYRRDVRGRFTKMGNSIEHINDVSATDVRPGMSVPRHAPEGDELAMGPVAARLAVMVAPDDSATTIYTSPQGALTRAAARGAGPMDPTPYLVGLDDGLSPEARAQLLARQQVPGQVTSYGDETGRTMSPTRAQDIAPRRR
jgi:hypothetical protein